MRLTSFFSPDYFTARDRFRDAIKRLGASTESHTFAARGPKRESLTMDFATLGDPSAERVLIVSSGLHGVEGFFGSAVQLAWLARLETGYTPPDRTTIVFAHALNPFGFAWVRRWNENNVDLNRNFLSDRAFLTDDPVYAESRAASERQAEYLNPKSPPTRREPYFIKALARIVREGYAARARLPRERRPNLLAIHKMIGLGIDELRKCLPVGQYEHPRNIFFGGSGDEETTRVLKEHLPQWCGDADQILHVDLHTGLGPFGTGKLLIENDKGSHQERWLTAQFGDAIEATDGSTAYRNRGDLGKYFQKQLGNRYQGLTAEFGTYPATHMLGVLRAENRAHFHARPDSAIHAWAKHILLEAFVPASTAWRNRTVRLALKYIDRSLEVLAADRRKLVAIRANGLV